MDDNALIEVLERIADALEAIHNDTDSIHSELRLLPAPLEEMCTKSHAWARLYEIGNAAEIWSEIHQDEVVR